LVIRYFGGIKLGAGGLVRAYAGAAESVLSAVERMVHQPSRLALAVIDFADEQPLRHWCERHDATITKINYGQQVAVSVDVPEPATEAFSGFCNARGLNFHFDT
jgi:putative IMPACT (imprinted ancient) family translation regulator